MDKKYDKIVIGIDQSYTATGISIGIDGELSKVSSINYKGLKSKSEKRRHIKYILNRLLTKATHKASKVIIICERIRTFSGGGKGKDKGHISPSFLKMTGALIAAIVDVAAEFDVNVYSVDTRSWKSKIVGSSKSKKDKNGKKDAKGDTVKFIQGLGFDLFIREKMKGKNKGEKIFDDDAADSGCIALYGFLPIKQQRLELEE